MLDIIARLLISSSILVGTAYLPSLAPAGTGRVSAAGATPRDGRACPPRRDMNVRACIA